MSARAQVRISQKTYKVIWGQFAAQCAICHERLINVNELNNTSLVGEVAHIVGETERAARGSHSMPPAERNQPENLILLCRKHHKQIDDDEMLYTVEGLHQIKMEYLQWKESSLAKALPWQTTLSQLCYINVPRLCELAELQGYSPDLSKYRDDMTLHSLGWDLNHVMSAFKSILSNLSLTVIPVKSLEFAHEGYIGSAVAFDRLRFRTKNVPMNVMSKNRVAQVFSGDLSKDPHIYYKERRWTLILNIDPNWITTSTAFTLFRPSSGQSTFSGLARITNVDYLNDRMFGTPLVIGLPRDAFHEMLEEYYDNQSETRERPPADANSLDRLADLEEGKRRGTFFLAPPEVCDLCRRTLRNEEYMIDGHVLGPGYWACMCSACFSQRGKGIAWGSGQLYLRQKDRWLQVAGFSPEDPEPEEINSTSLIDAIGG